MLAQTLSACILGVDGVPVRVEVDVAFGLPGLTIVGLAGSAVQEARERVRSAIRNSGYEVPARRITVNLAPADLPKEGTGYDLAIAIAILAASGQLPAASSGVTRTALIAELALDGSLRPVPGAMALVAAVREAGIGSAIVAAGNDAEAAAVRGIEVHPATSLGQAIGHLSGAIRWRPPRRRHCLMRRRSAVMRIWPTSSVNPWRGERWRSPSRAVTTWRCTARRASERR
jgi:magnesium chelatase family protein